MKGKVGLAAAAILLGALPAVAQRRVPVVHAVAPRARPVIMPNHAVRYVRPAPPPVRVVQSPVRVVQVHPQRPVPYVAPNLPPTSTAGSTTPVAPPPVVTTLGGTPISLGQLLNPTPGLGFDFTHLAAINSDLAVRALINPLTQHELALALQLPQVQPAAFYSGYPAYGGYVETQAATAPTQPQIIVLQQPASRAAAAAPAPAPAPKVTTPPLPPLPPLGALLLVQRNGKVIRAIAFSEEGKDVVYITSDGRRRTIAIDQINVKATEERNAEHGTILHFSN